jgi:rod shape-determining protein MreD
LTALRYVVTAAALLFAVVLQTAAMPLLGLRPPSAQIVLVLVCSIALSRGRTTGMIVGFVAGILLDVAPPADHPVGRFALAYCVAGYVMGALRGESRRSAFLPMALVALGAFIGNAVDVLLGTVFGYVHTSFTAVATVVPLVVLYDVVLTPFVFPLVAAADKKLVSYRHLPL